MMAIPHRIKSYMKESALIKIRTKDQVVYYGYITSICDIGIIMLLITDFHVDGYIFISYSYIDELNGKNTIDYDAIIQKTGIIKKSFLTKYNKIEPLKQLLNIIHCQLITINQLDNPTNRVFGQIIKLEETHIELQQFSSKGKWQKKIKIPHSNIGFIQRQSEYLRVYTKHVVSR